jgi:hypothetical protein
MTQNYGLNLQPALYIGRSDGVRKELLSNSVLTIKRLLFL